MGADPTEERLSCSKLKSEAVVHGHGTFPSVRGTDKPFDPEGGVQGIAEKKGEFYCEAFFGGQVLHFSVLPGV